MFEINLLLPHLFAPMSRSAKVSADHQERPDLIKLGANGKTVLQGTEIQIWVREFFLCWGIIIVSLVYPRRLRVDL